MTAVKPPSAYRSGFCSGARHDRCRGDYGTAVCDCGCHRPEPEPEVPGEIAATLTDLAVTAAAAAKFAYHCPTCTCGGVS